MDHTANLAERITYSAYGEARHHWAADVDGDGAVTNDDRTIIHGLWNQNGWTGTRIHESGYRAEADLNRDGVINEDDYDLSATLKAALGAGTLSSSDVQNIVGYAGYLFNGDIRGVDQYHVRHRVYDPGLGRWITRDPAGFVDGMNLYEYATGSPLVYVDPSGQIVVLIHGVWTDGGWYKQANAGLQAYWTNNNLCPQEIIEFKWFDANGRPGGGPGHAAWSVDSMRLAWQWDAVNRLALLLASIDAIRTHDRSSEGVTVIAHSQGSVLTVAALQQPSAKVDNLIILGSPLAWRDDLRSALGNVRGKVFNYFSSKDEVANGAGGLRHGAIGKVGANLGHHRVVDREFDDGIAIHGYTIPRGPKPNTVKAPRHSWYMKRDVFFERVYGPDVAATGDGKLSGRKDLLRHWRRVAAQ